MFRSNGSGFGAGILSALALMLILGAQEYYEDVVFRTGVAKSGTAAQAGSWQASDGSGNYMSYGSPALASDRAFNAPADVPAVGEVVTAIDTAGNTEWALSAGGVWLRNGTDNYLYPATVGDRVLLTGGENIRWLDDAGTDYAFLTYDAADDPWSDYPTFAITDSASLLFGVGGLVAPAAALGLFPDDSLGPSASTVWYQPAPVLYATQGGDPAAPASGQLLYFKAGGIYYRVAAGTVYGPFMTPFTIDGDTGTAESVGSGDAVLILGGTGIGTTVSATDTLTVSLNDTAVTPGNYTSADITVDQQGRITSASNGSSGGAPDSAAYIVAVGSAGLSAERTLTGGYAMDVIDSGSNSTYELLFDPTEVNDTTWLDGNDRTWTFDQGAGTDPGWTFSDKCIQQIAGYYQFVGQSGKPAGLFKGEIGYDYTTQEHWFYTQNLSGNSDSGHILIPVGTEYSKGSTTACAYGTVGNTETVIATMNFQGDSNPSWANSKVIRVRGWGWLTTGTQAADTLTFKLRWNGTGGTQLASTAAWSCTNSLSSRLWRIECDILFTLPGVNSWNVYPEGEAKVYTATTTAVDLEMVNATTVNIATNADTSFDLTATWGGTATSDTLTCAIFTVEIMD